MKEKKKHYGGKKQNGVYFKNDKGRKTQERTVVVIDTYNEWGFSRNWKQNKRSMYALT